MWSCILFCSVVGSVLAADRPAGETTFKFGLIVFMLYLISLFNIYLSNIYTLAKALISDSLLHNHLVHLIIIITCANPILSLRQQYEPFLHPLFFRRRWQDI
jgi:hypothetical protein